MSTSSNPPLRTPWLSVAALLVLLSWCGLHPARAGMQHVHNWTAGTKPTFLYVQATHLGGAPITPYNPALPCEILEVQGFASPTSDYDICNVAGCPFTDGTAAESEDNAERWFEQDAGGHFVQDTSRPSINREFEDPLDGKLYGQGGNRVYYRVAREHP